jgi:acylphosphatase
MKKALRIIVQGRVQNVGFRYSTHEKAKGLGICGYVMNQPDGSVLIEAEAEEEILNAFVLWCHQGPDWARVLELKVTDKPVNEYKSFEIRR